MDDIYYHLVCGGFLIKHLSIDIFLIKIFLGFCMFEFIKNKIILEYYDIIAQSLSARFIFKNY